MRRLDFTEASPRIPAPGPRARGLRRDLEGLLGAGAASCEPADVWGASRDGWPRALRRPAAAPHRPDVVAWPADAQGVAAAIRYAIERGVAIVPVGGGSGVSGAAVPVKGGIALDLKRLRSPLAIDLPGRSVQAGAGLNGQRLEEQLGAAGATLGHFPAAIHRSTVGGWIASRSAGQLSGRYGKIEDMVLSLEAVDGTGAMLRTLEAPSSGPDLTQLLAGSEGTLAVITAAKLRIWPRPTGRWLRAVRFSAVADGLRAVRAVLRSGLRPAVVRLSDAVETRLLGAGLGSRLPAPLRWAVGGAQAEALRLALRAPALLNRLADALPPSSLLVLGFEGHGPSGEDEAADEGARALALCRELQGADEGPVSGERWLAPEGPSGQGTFPAGNPVEGLDVAATWDRVPAVHEAVRRAAAPHGLAMARFGHAALEGCAIEFAFALGSEGKGGGEDETPAVRCWTAALSAALDAGATLSHHRGVGLARQAFLPREHGEGMRQLRALKRAFDPHGVLNPGKLLL